jgi:UDP-GlcNAc:undecaprenyl-phosphate/decaprenyl-phosphate GlcNAc-1-phosphate transferase
VCYTTSPVGEVLFTMVFFIIALILSAILTAGVRFLALAFEVVDRPDGERKLHTTGVPLLGGVAIFLAFWAVVAYVVFFTHRFEPHVGVHQLLGIFVASFLLVVMGSFDDWKSLSPGIRLVVTAVAALIVLGGGVTLSQITNPLGGAWHLDQWKIPLAGGMILVFGDTLVFFWLMGMMYTTKILDGLDGLAAGIVTIGLFMIYFLTLTKKFFQPDVGLLALIAAGVLLGFLIFNFHPARIFLGEGGSLLIGLILGVLAVISGGKIATALLVMAVPVLDLGRVIYVRYRHGRSVFQGDREHLHFRLRDAGFSEWGAVLFLYVVAIAFGATTLFLQSKFKLITLAGLAVSMILVGVWLSRKPRVSGSR